MKRILTVGCSLLGFVVTCHSKESKDVRGVAESQIRRLPPTAFAVLPKQIMLELQSRGCTVPQVYGSPKPHNVIRGEFQRKGQVDWAVLCSRHGLSSVLVYWNGSPKAVAEIAKGPDTTWLQDIGDGKIGYSREISAVGKKFIVEHYSAYGGPKPPPIDHQGINDAFVGKASIVRYYYRGNWLELTGAD